jgi:hypothetical protein
MLHWLQQGKVMEKKKCSKKITLPKITDKITKLIALIVREREREEGQILK